MRRRRSGFILVLVVTALALAGAVMFILTGGANVMLFHADTAYLRAVEDNLTASGLAWARARIAAGNLPSEPVALDVSTLGPPETRLVVHIVEVQGTHARIRLETSCRKGRRTLDSSREYAIELP